jgi:hypothetical protein
MLLAIGKLNDVSAEQRAESKEQRANFGERRISIMMDKFDRKNAYDRGI